MFGRTLQTLLSATSILAIGCATASRTGAKQPSVDDAVALVVERVLRKPVFRSAVEVPICVEDQLAHVDTEYVVSRVVSSDPRARNCNGSTFEHPTYIQIRSVAQGPNGYFFIHAGYYCGNLCADDSTYTLAIVGARWKIIEEKQNWIS